MVALGTQGFLLRPHGLNNVHELRSQVLSLVLFLQVIFIQDAGVGVEQGSSHFGFLLLVEPHDSIAGALPFEVSHEFCDFIAAQCQFGEAFYKVGSQRNHLSHFIVAGNLLFHGEQSLLGDEKAQLNQLLESVEDAAFRQQRVLSEKIALVLYP